MRSVVVDELAVCTVDEINCTWGLMWLCFLMIGVDEVVTQPIPTGRYPPSGLIVKHKSKSDSR